MSSENDTDYITNYDHVVPDGIKFWFYLVFLIPSIICSLFALCYILVNRTLRHALNNHVIIVVLFIGLIYEVTTYPWMLYYYHYVGIWHRSPIFCTIWSFIDWGLYFTQTILFAWATIERHILIFHDRWLSTKKKRFFIHYLPLIILLVYCLVFYIVVQFFPPCENSFDDSDMICVQWCFTENHTLYMWDALVHQTLPNLIIVIFSIALLVRVLWQKHRMCRPIKWRTHRKMTIQLLSISIIYLISAFPLTLMNFMYLCGLPDDVGVIAWEYLLFLNYFMLLFFPFACILSLPGLREKINNILQFRQKRRVTTLTT